jgi:hypothetical protein
MLSRSARESLSLSISRYVSALADNPGCVNYLANRGIEVDPDLPADYGNVWQLGHVQDPDPGHEHLAGRLCIPYLVPRGGPVGANFRCIADHDCTEAGHKKYYAQTGMGKRLFGAWLLHTTSPFIGVAEGELDAIVATEAGIPAVAIPGATKWQDHWRYLFDGFEQVLVLADGDTDGRKLADRLVGELQHARPVNMPDEQDVTSFVLANGAAALRQRAGLG